MNLTHLQDQELLDNTKDLAQTERTTLTKILHHLREIDRRRLYSDLGCASLFDYAVKHLQYSEGQAGRRIQAMRLLREILEIESKIESGALTLSNICQAQSFFRDVGHTTEDGRPKILAKDDKVKILGLLENKPQGTQPKNSSPSVETRSYPKSASAYWMTSIQRCAL